MQPDFNWQTHANEIAEWLKAAVKGGGDFVAEQAPLVVQEYVCYMRTAASVYTAVALVLVVLGFWLAVRSFREWEKDKRSESDVLFFLATVSIAIGAIVFACHSNTCLKAWTAPRVLVLEKASEILNHKD